MNQLTSSPQGISLDKHYEGLGPHFNGKIALPYVCPAGKLTAGYGHVVQPGEDFSKGLTPEQADALLRRDLRRYEQAILTNVKVKLTQAQFDALACFCLNLGTEALRTSTLLKKLNAGDYEGAANEFPKWCHAKVKGKTVTLDGLYYRRLTERHLFLTGEIVYVHNHAEAEALLGKPHHIAAVPGDDVIAFVALLEDVDDHKYAEPAGCTC